MRKNTVKIFILFLLAVMFLSCEALPNLPASQSWKTSDDAGKTTLTILGVYVDRTGGWDSIEKETLSFAPLYFWEQGFRIVGSDEEPEYAAQIQLREREFNLGWRSRRSLSAEVFIWVYEDIRESGALTSEQKLPAAAGRITATGNQSFSSSQTLTRMLSKAIRETVKKLTLKKR